MAWNQGSNNGAGCGGQGAASAKATARQGGAKHNGLIKGLVAGLVVVLGAVGCFVWLTSGGDATEVASTLEKKPAKIAEGKVVEQHLEMPEEPVKDTRRRSAKGTIIPVDVKADENGILRYPSGLRWVDTNDLHRVEHPKKKKLFKRSCNNQIALLIGMNPAKMSPFFAAKRKPYDQRFVADFKASLGEAPDPEREDDTDEDREMRKLVSDTREELRQAMERGEDIAALMTETQTELARLAAYRDELRKTLRKAENDGSFTDQDVQDYVTAANEMLEKQGLPKFAMPSLINRQARLELIRERQAQKEAK